MRSRACLLASCALVVVVGACNLAADGPVDAGSEGEGEDAGQVITEIGLGDGTVDGCGCPGNNSVTGGQMGVVLNTPAGGPVHLQTLRYFVCDDPLPETEFRVRVSTFESFPNTAALPGAELLTADVRAAAPATGGWVDVDVSTHDISLEEGDFFVSMEWLTGTGPTCSDAQLIGIYEAEDPDVQTWFTRDNHA